MSSALMAPLGGIANTLLGSGSQTTTASGNSSQSGSTSQSGTSNQTSGGTTAGSQSTNGLSSTDYNLSPQFQQMQNGIPAQWSQMMYNASKPILGQNQQTAYMGQVNQGYNQSAQNLMQMLAKRGALSSGSAGSALSNLAVNKMGQQGQYLAQAPVQNQQYSDAQQQAVMAQGMGYKPMVGQTTANQSQSYSLQDISNFINQLFSTQGTSTQTGTTNSTTTKGGTGLMGAIGL